jgi:hypothetical protein
MELEDAYNEARYKLQIAEGEIERAHKQLDAMGAPRTQDNGLTYSLEGRLRMLAEK